MRDGGKGDRQRPLGVDEETFASNWDQIFKNKKKEETKEEVQDDEVPDRRSCRD